MSAHEQIQIFQEDVLSFLKRQPDSSVDLFVTSPPYWKKRRYQGGLLELGQEKDWHDYINNILAVSKEVKRVVKPTGSFWLNLADSYSGAEQIKDDSSEGSLLGIPQRIFIRMLDEQGWQSPNYCPWFKKNSMPGPWLNRFTNMYEPFMWFVKSKKTRLWQDAKTFEWYWDKPQMAQFSWQVVSGYTKSGKPKRRKVGINYYGHRYFFDLEKIRVPQQYPLDVVRRKKQDKAQGVLPWAKDNQDGIAWRHDQLPYDQMAYRRARWAREGKDIRHQFDKELRYNGKFKGSGEGSEAFGSPRARNERPKYAPTGTRDSAYEAVARTREEGKDEAILLFPNDPEKQEEFNKLVHDFGPTTARTKLLSQTYEQGVISPQKRADMQGIAGGASMSNPRGKNPGDVFVVPTHTLKEAHFASFPLRLIIPLVLSCSPPPRPDHPSVVCDPFTGSGTVALVAQMLNRDFIGCDLNPEYIKIAWKRIYELRAQAQALKKALEPKIDFYVNYANAMDRFLSPQIE